ncbi:MAG: hypothetical protein Q8O05_02800 [Chloroflexota bacterium]|nr:hypothetical protein [Chloroflexota bacterium]
MAEAYMKAVDHLIEVCAIQKGENVLVLTEHEGRLRTDHFIAQLLAKKAMEKGAHVSVMFTDTLPTGSAGEPSENVRQAIFSSDLSIILNHYAFLYNKTTYEAIFQYPTRILNIIGSEANRETLATPHIAGNMAVLQAIHQYWREKLFGEKEVRMTSKRGTDFTCLTPPGGLWSGGTQRNKPVVKGAFRLGYWQGEGIIWPRETGNGVIYFDGFYGTGYSEDPIICHFKDGWCTKIESGGPRSKADKLKEVIAPFAGPPGAPHPYNMHCTEWALGINPTARIYLKPDDEALIEAQRNVGVCHVALGSRRVGNPPLGHAEFNCGIHVDGTILDPTVTVDGEKLVEDGIAIYLNDPVLRERVRKLGEDPDIVLKQERKVIK